MSQVNDTNYPNQVPLAADYALFVRDSDGVLKTATMQQYADLFASLAGENIAVSVVSINTTLTTEQMLVVTAAGNTDQTLPASSLNTGRTFRIANKGAGTVSVLPDGTDTIEGAPSITLAQYETATLRSDGLGMWFRF